MALRKHGRAIAATAASHSSTDTGSAAQAATRTAADLARLLEETRRLQAEVDRLEAERAGARSAEDLEAELKEKIEELERYFTWSVDLLCIADTDGYFRRLNPQWQKTLGYSIQELEGRRFLDLVHPDDLQATLDKIETLRAQEDVLNFTNRYRHADGTYRWLEWRSAAPKGRTIYAVARDITVRLEQERRLLHAQKLESLGLLAGGIAHDFNNLLTAVIGNLDIALYGLPHTSHVRPNIEQAIMASHRAADLVRQMLAYSGRGPMLAREVDLSELIGANAELLRASVGRGVRLELRLQRPLPLVTADPGHIQQVAVNLVTNGAESIGEGQPGVVLLTTGVRDCDEEYLLRNRCDEQVAPGRYAFIEVIDNGSGMNEVTLERLFDPFFTTKFAGRGLGMAAVLGIVRVHNGAILVDSTVGRGTAVTVLFPVAARPAAELSQPPAPTGAHAIPAPLTAGGVGLVVDDEDIVRSFCASVFVRLGLRALTASSGEKAIALFRDHASEITVVLLDSTIPGMSGVAIVDEMRRLKPDVKVILSSGFEEEEATRKYAGRGLAAFLQKPFTLQAMRDALARVLETTERP